MPPALGATADSDGVTFAIYSAHATAVELCLFDSHEAHAPQRTIALGDRTGNLWHAHVPGVRAGQAYGYRVHGPWDPANGKRFNPAKILLDPYARAIARAPLWHPSLLAYEPGSEGDGAAETTDTAPYAPLGAVVDLSFEWGDDRLPQTPWADTVIYEAHVKGATIQHPDVEQRGSYLGLTEPAFVDHLRRLGVTAIELMPVFAHAAEPKLIARGLSNYWGYNPLAYFVPDPRFVSTGSPLHGPREFKTMVKALHAAGLEVILDVVFNHTAEGDHLGPHLSFRGIDNEAYYRLEPGRRSRYEDFTGCGNTVDQQSAPAHLLMMDSLRYWAREMHVDGFRFDLAPALARGPGGVAEGLAQFFTAVRADPTLQRLKLTAEPWDAAPGGFHLGRFPPGWAEWNGRYRDTVRRFWRGDAGMVADLATRLAGSQDLLGAPGRSPLSSVNFVTSHDGFTLADLVSYEHKYNEANGDANHDGESNNFSWNSGEEGPASRADVIDRRLRARRNLMLTLLVSQGVPMISGGDEIGRTQEGNNNAYCHDSPLSWTSWEINQSERDFLAFVARVTELRRTHAALRQTAFLRGTDTSSPNARWLRPDGAEMTIPDWRNPEVRALALQLDDALIVLNAGEQDVAWTLPALPGGSRWTRRIDTAAPAAPPTEVSSMPVPIAAHSAAVFTPKF
jgi:isoamylase